MTNSKPTIIDDLPLVTDNLTNYTKYTVVGKDNGEFATIAPLSEFARELSVYSNGIYNNGYNKMLAVENIPLSLLPYNIDTSEYFLAIRYSSSNQYISPQCTLDNVGDIYNIKYFDNNNRTLNFVKGKLLDGNTESVTISLVNGLNLKFMMVGLDSNNDAIFVRLRRAI
jgi:hypothetical protein